MLLKKYWALKNTHADEKLLAYTGSRVLAVLLQNRGIDSPEKAEKFLNPLKNRLLSLKVFNDASKAVNRIKQALKNNEHITVYGDFDADGITASAVLYLTLKELGASCDFYLPDRESESHGLNTKALVQIISKRKSKLIITVDCGISNVKEVNFAESLGSDVIITDHHEAPGILPEACAVINPKAPDNIDSALDMENIQSLNYLSGAGIALKFAYALLEEYNRTDFADILLPIAAIGTIGDIVELAGENRTIAAAGIELIKNGAHKGIQVLLKEAGINDVSAINSETIAFTVVPRLNAAGRLETAETAFKMLVSEDDALLKETALKLNDLNALRQTLCSETFETADKMLQQDKAKNRHAVVLFNPEWHIGIIGIAASRLVEKYNKPVFLMTSDLKNPDIIRCSCRSIQGVNIHAVLSEHKEKFEGFGGHKMAAGFAFDIKKIPFESLKTQLLNTIDRHSENIDFKKITISADMELEPEDITEETIHLIDKLQPFGSANPAPLFTVNNAVLQNFRFMGQNSEHLKFNALKNGFRLECIKWNTPDFNMPSETELDLLFSMRLNTFNNITSVQLMIEDIHSKFLDDKQKQIEISFLDHRKKRGILDRVIDYALSSKKSSAVYMENPLLIKNLKLPDAFQKKLFSMDNIPENIGQIMFFEAPASKEDFEKIINTAHPSIVHLMDFGIEEISAPSLIAKLAGMIKYAVSNLHGIISTKRAAKALGVSEEAAECALALLDDCGMIDLTKTDDDNYTVSYIHPIEISQAASSGIYSDLENYLKDINEFRHFYLTSPPDELKEAVIR